MNPTPTAHTGISNMLCLLYPRRRRTSSGTVRTPDEASGLTRVRANGSVRGPVPLSPPLTCGALRMRRNAWSALVLSLGLPALLSAQGFGIYEHNSCTMARGGVAAASPCPDGSAIFFNPAGLVGLSGTHLTAGVTLIRANGGFTDDFLLQRTDLDDPLIPVPSGFVTHAITPKVTVGVGLYVPYGLETKWPTAGFEGRFLGYNTKIHSIYVQPPRAYPVGPRLKGGLCAGHRHGSG